MKGAHGFRPDYAKTDANKIARAYYDESCTQQEIGERFGSSRRKGGPGRRKKRVAENIVKISFLEPKDNTYLEIENQIEKKYQIDEVLRCLRGIIISAP